MWNSTLLMTGFGVDWDTGGFRLPARTTTTSGPCRSWGSSASNGSAANGYDVGLAYLRYLAQHPATARAHRAEAVPCGSCRTTRRRRSCRRSRRPTWPREPRSSRCCGSCSARRSSPASLGQKVRRPVRGHRRDGAHPRASSRTRPATEGMQGLYWMVDGLGNAPLAWPPPDGYPDEAATWRVGGRHARPVERPHVARGALVAGPAHDAAAKSYLPSPLPATHGELVQAPRSSGSSSGTLPAAQRDGVLAFVGKPATDAAHKRDEAVAGGCRTWWR